MYLTINWFIKTGWRGMIVWDFGVQRKLVLWLARQWWAPAVSCDQAIFFFFLAPEKIAWLPKKKSPDRRLAVSNMY